MKYHPLYEGRGFEFVGDTWTHEGVAYGYGPFNTFSEAQGWIKARAERMDQPLTNYSVHCGDLDQNRRPVPASAPTQDPNPKQAYGDKKLAVHLVPPALVLEAAPNMMDGRDKYGAYNYRDSKIEVMTYLGAIQRHTMAYLDGEDVDPESKRGATHLGAIAACVAIIADARNKGLLIDNRPTKGTAGEVIRKAAGVVLPTKDETK